MCRKADALDEMVYPRTVFSSSDRRISVARYFKRKPVSYIESLTECCNYILTEVSLHIESIVPLSLDVIILRVVLSYIPKKALNSDSTAILWQVWG